MSTSQPLLSPALVVACVVMAIAAAVVCRLFLRQSPWTVPAASARAALQLAAVAGVLAAAMSRLWSSMVVLVVMFVVAAATAARRSQADRGSVMLTVSLAAGMLAVIPLLLAAGVIPMTGVAIVPVFGRVLGGTMTAVSVAARRALDELTLRVALPGAFVGVLLATGSVAQAAAVQVMVLTSLLLAQACGVAVTGELIARGEITRQFRR